MLVMRCGFGLPASLRFAAIAFSRSHAFEHLRPVELVQRERARLPLQRDVTPRVQEALDRGALVEVVVLVPAFHLLQLTGGLVGQHRQQSTADTGHGCAPFAARAASRRAAA